MHELHVFLEDSNRIKELEAKISDLEQKLRAANAKVLEIERKYINEVTKNLALEDKVRIYGRNADYWRERAQHDN